MIRSDWVRGGGAPAALAVIVAIAAVARFATLNEQGLWLDEASTVEFTLRPTLGETLGAVAEGGYTPHLYFALAWLWSQAFGEGEFALRSISALVGTAAVVVGYAIGRELRSRGAGLLLAALVAVHGGLFWYSQELRVYALYLLLSSLSFLFFLRSRRTEDPRDLAAWSLCSAIAIASHYFAGFLVAVEAGWLLLAARRSRRIVFALLPVAAVSLAYAPLALDQSGAGDYSAFGSFGSRLMEFGQHLFAPGHPYIAIGVACVAAAAIFLSIRRAGREGSRSVLTCLAVASIVLGIAVVPAPFGLDFFFARNLLPVTIVLLAAIAVAVSALPPPSRIAFAAILIGALGFSSVSQMLGGDPQRPDWRGAAEIATEERARVVLGGSLSSDSLRYYLPEDAPVAGGVYRARRVALITQCGTDWHAMLDAVERDCEWADAPPAGLPDEFREVRAQRLGNVLIRVLEAARPAPVDVSPVADRITYAAFVLPSPDAPTAPA